MKKLTFLIATLISIYTFAGDGSNTEHGSKYCAKMKDGKLVVMHNDKTLTSDATLDNGTTIKTDGTILKKDGSTVMLKAGECANMEGKVMKETPKTKTKTKNSY
jgi:hypothetical protein